APGVTGGVGAGAGVGVVGGGDGWLPPPHEATTSSERTIARRRVRQRCGRIGSLGKPLIVAKGVVQCLHPQPGATCPEGSFLHWSSSASPPRARSRRRRRTPTKRRSWNRPGPPSASRRTGPARARPTCASRRRVTLG